MKYGGIMRFLPLILIGFGITSLVYGIVIDEPQAVFDIAIRICLSCMGLE